MTKLMVLSALLNHPREMVTLGYQAMMRRQHTVDYEKMTWEKHHVHRLPTIDLLDLQPDLKDSVNVYSFLPNTSGITDILLLRLLARKFRNCDYLEIGSFRGESIASVAEVAANCTSITLSKEQLKEYGFSEDEIRVHGMFSEGIKNITSIYHDSQTFDFNTLGKKYDLLFIDGDHSYNGVLNDTRNIFRLLKDDHSIVVWHDYGIDPASVRHEVLAAILDGTPPEFRRHLYHVSNTIAAIFIREKFPTTYISEQPYPNKTFKVSVECKKFSDIP